MTEPIPMNAPCRNPEQEVLWPSPLTLQQRFGLWVWDRRSSSCLLCSPQLVDIFGATKGELLQDFSSPAAMGARLHDEDRDRYCAQVGAALAGRVAYETDYRIVTPSGIMRHLYETGDFIRNGDKREYDLRVVHDVTEQRRHALETAAARDRLGDQAERFARLAADLESAKRSAEEARRQAEDASRAKSEFLANMSHELRTPLNAVIGFAQMMAAEMFGRLGNDRYREYCHDILSSGNHLLEVINQLLDLSRIEAGRVMIEEEQVDLAYTIDICQKLVRGRADRKQVTITTRCADVPPVLGDDRSLRQILLNLLSNAVKFTPPGGSITIECELEPSGAVRLSVVDTGIGMTPEQLARIGEPFAQGRNSLVTDEIGSGLGLSIVKSLIELHGGALQIESQVSVGTTVSVILPPERVVSSPDVVPAHRDKSLSGG